MSSTNRGSKRIDSDFYITPESTIHKFLESYHCDMNGLNIFEPCAGEGAICKAIKSRYPHSHIWANEIRDAETDNLKSCCDLFTCRDFLNIRDIHKIIDVDIIITNPPFSLAQEIIEHCFEVSQGKSTIIMLLRLSFLESKRRYDFWKRNPVNGLYVLSSRPSFTGGGTDSCAYSWFVWNGANKQEIKII